MFRLSGFGVTTTTLALAILPTVLMGATLPMSTAIRCGSITRLSETLEQYATATHC
jgi:hypothetical protein